MGNFLQDLDNLLLAAIEESHLEDRLHLVLNNILTAYKETIVTDAKTTISSSIQVRTVDQRLYDEFRSIRLTTIPDGGLLLHLRQPGLEACKRTISLMSFELKRLFIYNLKLHESANLYDAWMTEDALGTAETTFRESIPQLLFQGFCTLHAHQGQDTGYVAHLVGIYLTVLRFRRPPVTALPALPRNASYNHRIKKGTQKEEVGQNKGGDESGDEEKEDEEKEEMEQGKMKSQKGNGQGGVSDNEIKEYRVGNRTVASMLFPVDAYHYPEVVVAGEPLVHRDANGDIHLSQACRYVLSLAHEQGERWFLGRHASVIFDFVPGSFTPDEEAIAQYREYIEDWFAEYQPASIDAMSVLSESPEDHVPDDSPYIQEDTPSNAGETDPADTLGVTLRLTRSRVIAARQAEEIRQLQTNNPFGERPPSPGASTVQGPLV